MSRFNRHISQFVHILVISLFLGVVSINCSFGQETKKNRVRLKADYVKIMDGDSYFDLRATAKIDKKTIGVPNLSLIIYNELEDEQILLDSVVTDMHGDSRFTIKNFTNLKTDSTQTYNFLVSFKGNDGFNKAKRNVQFKDAAITANVFTKDSIHYVSATLKEVSTDSLLIDQSLTVQVQRLFKALKIGEEFNNTDNNGTILVPIESGIPGVDGNLNVEVVLDDSDEYGTVKAIVKAPIGTPIVDESTFDERTMWGPKNKTPLFILIFANLLMFSIWGIILYLIINLFKIVKLKS